ncbi:MAG: hypothetical protein R3B97_07740 [Dehalococcoidia bacterium]
MMKRNRRMFVLSAAAGIVATAGAVAAIVPGFAEDGARPATTADFQQRATGAQAIASPTAWLRRRSMIRQSLHSRHA